MQIDPDPAHDSPARFIRLFATFCGLVSAAWLLLYFLWWSFPYVQPGHDQIYDLKLEIVARGEVFSGDAPIRVGVFGDSRVLSGFNPDLFDELSQGQIESYNLGLPNLNNFLDILETMAANGSSPTHALLVFPWSSRPQVGFWDSIQDDRLMVGRLFPFRHFPRDLSQFLVRSYQHGGIRLYYDYMKKQVESARRDRGYFFIEHMSHFPGHSLPKDFRLETENPSKVLLRRYELEGKAYKRLQVLADQHGIRFIMVPLYHRERQYGAPGSNEGQRLRLEKHGVSLAGPDYWLYPNEFFSDPTHLNRRGAAEYTQRLWKLVAPRLLARAPQAVGVPDTGP
jgi:hypothetical protein